MNTKQKDIEMFKKLKKRSCRFFRKPYKGEQVYEDTFAIYVQRTNDKIWRYPVSLEEYRLQLAERGTRRPVFTHWYGPKPKRALFREPEFEEI